jgi:lipopolysaccharide export system permease protein
MKTLRRYLVKEVVGSIALVLVGLLLLYLVIDFYNEFADAESRRNTLQTLLISISSIPANVYILLPIAALLGTLFALAQMNANSEYTVMRASGASVQQILMPLAALGLGLAVTGFLLAEFVVPAAESLSVRARAYSGNTKTITQKFKSGFWFREGRTFINISSVLPDKTLTDVRVFQFDKNGELTLLMTAATASHEGETQWKLEDVVQQAFTRERIESKAIAELTWSSVLTPNMLSVLQMQPDRLTASSLWEYTQHLRKNNQKSNRFEAALWGKLLYPLACVVLMMLALPFSQNSRRSGGVSSRIFIGILVGLVFVLSNRLFSFLGQLYNWPPSLAALTPYALFIGATLLMIYRVERR